MIYCFGIFFDSCNKTDMATFFQKCNVSYLVTCKSLTESFHINFMILAKVCLINFILNDSLLCKIYMAQKRRKKCPALSGFISS